MSTKSRQERAFKGKIKAYVFLLILLIVIFIIGLVFLSRNPLFVSPIGKSNIEISSVEKLLRKSNILFSSVVLSDLSYIVSIPNSGQIRLSSQKDIGKQISSLQRILRELTIEGKPFKNIDFRFDKPIISF